MGGFGSGSHRHRGAQRCEDMHRVDLADLRRFGVFDTGTTTGTLVWRRGQHYVRRVGYKLQPHRMDFAFKPLSSDHSDWAPRVETVQFGWTKTAFGGRRRWFVCPSCLRNCRVLYHQSRFRCRQCLNLVYQCQYEQGIARAMRRVRGSLLMRHRG
jgi:hypothetical protein